MKSMPQKVELFRSNVRREVQRTGVLYSVVAEKAGICSTYLSRILNGRSDPTLPVCEKIAFALGTSLEALLAEPAKVAVSTPHIGDASRRGQKMAISENICR
jgi:transcriptional regulator with XRE-family HTH domain